MWESLSHKERVKLLTVDLQLLREKAKQYAETARHPAAAGRVAMSACGPRQ